MAWDLMLVHVHCTVLELHYIFADCYSLFGILLLMIFLFAALRLHTILLFRNSQVGAIQLSYICILVFSAFVFNVGHFLPII